MKKQAVDMRDLINEVKNLQIGNKQLRQQIQTLKEQYNSTNDEKE